MWNSRGDLPTVFSSSISSIKRIYGMERMIDILKALEMTSWIGPLIITGRGAGRERGVSDCLLQICYPLEGEDAEKLKALLKGTK